MIGTEASVPKRMLVGDDVDVVADGTANRFHAVGIWHVKILNHHHHAKWQEKHKGLIGVPGSVLVVLLHLVDEPSFCRIYALARTVVEYRRLSFFIYKYLEMFLHLQVTPATNIIDNITKSRVTKICPRAQVQMKPLK